MSPSSRPRVLIIDDEPAICELIEAVAEGAGFDARSASDPEEIETSISGSYDLVILDLSLGIIDGIEVMGKLGAGRRGLPIILVSGADQTLLDAAGRIAEMHRLRVLGTFTKPVSVGVLQSAMLEWSQAVESDPTGPKIRVNSDDLVNPEFLSLVYQPKVDARSGDVVGAEALVRWKHPEHGDVSPSIYVAVVEESGRTSELLDVVMTIAARDRMSHPKLAQLAHVSINVSVLDLGDDDLPRRAQRILVECAPADSWTFEITETTPIVEVTPAIAMLARLRLAGFGLSVDDFGTGTSNYERLLAAPFTELKIDRAMVARLDSSSDEIDPMVRSGVEIGHSLSLAVVAEGVETVDQWRMVRDIGCDIVQGYLVSPPVPPHQFDDAAVRWRERFANLL